MMTRAIEVVRRVAPTAKASYLSAFENGDALLQQHDITTPLRLSHFLAQCLHESGGLTLDWESGNYRAERIKEIFGWNDAKQQWNHSAHVTDAEARALAGNGPALFERVYGLGNPAKAQELGNTRPGDGFTYRGGGMLQTTGRSNYRRMGEKCGVDFEGTPDLIVSRLHALKPALAEWTEGGLNAFADVNDILSISRAINLGNPRSQRTPNGLEDRTRWLVKVQPWISRVDFDTGVISPPPPPPPVLPPVAPAVAALKPLLAGRELKLGDQGETVRAMQVALAKLGYNLKGTGYFGGATDTAVTDFQGKHGLKVDGIVGSGTSGAIDDAVAALAASGRAPVAGAAAAPAADSAGGRPLWLVEGLRWIDTAETLGAADNSEILEWARDEGGNIAATYNHDSIPWCALFANMVLTKVGLKGTETLWALDWANWGKKLDGPAVGAFAPMKREGGGHIAIVVGKDQSGNLMCLGGNQEDAVNIKPFPAARPLGFRWPNEAAPPARTGIASLPLVRSDGRVSRSEG